MIGGWGGKEGEEGVINAALLVQFNGERWVGGGLTTAGGRAGCV